DTRITGAFYPGSPARAKRPAGHPPSRPSAPSAATLSRGLSRNRGQFPGRRRYRLLLGVREDARRPARRFGCVRLSRVCPSEVAPSTSAPVGATAAAAASEPASTSASTTTPSASTSTSVPAPLPAHMLLVPAGSFTMGTDTGGEGDEHPAHTVTLAAFWLDKTEVT